MSKLFISYRREDSAYPAHSICERLKSHFGKDSLFIDVDTIPFGVDFRKHLHDAVGQCDVVLAVIGARWLDARQEDGTRRLDDPRDFVRIEIEAALARDIPLIPVLVDQVVMPKNTQLPDALSELAFRNATQIRPGLDFNSDLDRLIRGLQRLLKLEPGQAAAPTPQKTAPRQDVPAPVETPVSIQPVSNEQPPQPATGVDLAGLAAQKLVQQRTDAAEAQRRADDVQRQARELAEQMHDFAAAARLIETLEPRRRDAKLYEKIRGDRDQVAGLDARIHGAVEKGRLQFLRGSVKDLLRLQPQRDDMRRLLDALPEEPDLPKELTNSIGMRFVLIEPGEFTIGSNESDTEKPPHSVEITQPFYLGVFPVTQAEYQAVIGSNPSHFTGNAQHPVEQVDWNNAVAYCEKLSQVAAEAQHRRSYRLPTEAEWEYACRAGSTGKWCFGDNESSLGEYAWFVSNSDSRTHPVGEKKANAWGLHDMHGNVWEWCEDVYDKEAYASRGGATTNPLVTSVSEYRVLRGGSWNSYSRYSRSAYRLGFTPDSRLFNFGFRVVCWSSP